MPSITIKDGKVLLVEGKPASGAECCCDEQLTCEGGGPGLGTLDPINCGSYDFCCENGICVPATHFIFDIADCVCVSDGSAQPGDPGVYGTYAECCQEHFCPEPPP